MRKTSLASIGALGLAGLALAGCGGSSSSHSSSAAASASPAVAPGHTLTEKSRRTPASSNADIGQAGAQRSAPASRPSARSSGHTGVVAATTTHDTVSKTHVQKAKTQTSNDDTQGIAAAPNPCRLVSLPEAQSIAGSGITARIEAPLGPTCIYKSARTRAGITLAVQTRSLSQAARQLTKRKTVTVSGRTGYCGQLGAPMLVVSIGQGHVLNVSAPCTVAQRFAALALQRLTA